MNRTVLAVAALLPLSLALVASGPATGARIATTAKPAAAGALKPTDTQAASARLVYGLLSDSRYAYRPRALDDALSREIFDSFLETWDPAKVYLTAADVARFQQYRTTLDDAIKSGEMEPAYAMFALFRQRVNERTAFARDLLETGKFDFTGNEDRKSVV